jgi:lipoate-protein ligase A
MALVEFNDDIIAMANELKRDDETLEEFMNAFIRQLVTDLERRVEEKKKVENFIESYRNVPQDPKEYEIWQEEQVWDESR